MNDILNSLSLGFFLTFIVAGLVKGVTGMGLPTVAMGLLGLFMPPAAAAALLVVPSFVTNVWQLFGGRALGALLRRFAGLLLGIVAGTLAGASALASIDALWSGFALGVALIVYAAWALIAPPLFVSPRTERWLSPPVGLLTGLVAGVTGVFVMPAVPYLQSLQLGRERLIQALGLSFTVSALSLAGGLLLHGVFQVGQLGLSALAILPALAGMWLGQRIRARISLRTFRLCFLLFLIGLGLELMLRPAFR